MPIKESVRQRLTAILFVGQSLFSAAMIAIFTLMAIIAADLSGNDATAGIPSTLTILGRAVAAYPISLLLDRASRRIGLSTGFAVGVLGCVVAIAAIMAHSFLLFCAGALLLGMGRASSDQSRYIAAEVHLSSKRAKVIGLIVFAGTIGAVVGPLMVAPSQVFALSFGLEAAAGPFLIGILFYLIGMLLMVLFLRPDPKEIAQATEAVEKQTIEKIPPRPFRLIFQQPSVILAVTAMIIGQLVMALLMVITPLHMDHHNHSTQSISFVSSAHTFGMFAVSGVTGWLIDRYGRILPIVAGSFILIVASIMTPQSTAVLPLAAALFLLGLGWNFCFIAGSSLLADSLAASERARTQGISEMTVSLAAGGAGLATGLLFDRAGITAVSVVALAASLAILGAFFYYTLSRRLVQQPELG